MSNPWFRLYHEFADDPKVQMLSEANQRRLVMLFCLRCKGETLHDCYIAFQLRITKDEWAATRREFMQLGFIDEDNNILNWDERQYTSDSSTERVRKHRENKKHSVKHPCNVTVTPPDTDTDTDKKEPPLPPKGEELPDFIDVDVWADFAKHRGKKFTKLAASRIIKKLTTWHDKGHDVNEILNTSIMNGWKGVFEPDVKGETNGKQTAEQICLEAAAEFETEEPAHSDASIPELQYLQ